MQGIRLFNHNYKRFFGSKRKLAYLEDVEDVEVFHFFQCSFNCLKKSLERCLDDLVKRGLLIEEKSLIKVWRFRESMPSIATQNEVKIIKKIECSLLVKFNVTTKSDLMFTDKWPEFIDMLNKKLKRSFIYALIMLLKVISIPVKNVEQKVFYHKKIWNLIYQVSILQCAISCTKTSTDISKELKIKCH